MKRKLIFSFYLSKDWETSFSNKIHLACLAMYAKQFDYATFIIIYDLENESLVPALKHKIIDIGFENVEFILKENSLFREAKPFYEEVVLKLDSYNDMIMWGHNKGITNIYVPKKLLFNWLTSLYFGTIGLIDECEKKFISNYYGGEKYFYGTLLVEGKGENNGFYGGSFFLMNPVSIMKAIKRKGIELPKLSNRSYVEEFPGALFGMDRLGSFNDAYIFNKYSNFYEYTAEDWENTFILIFKGKNDIFKKMQNEIWKTINS